MVIYRSFHLMFNQSNNNCCTGTNYPFLFNYEYDFICKLKEDFPKQSFQALYELITLNIWRLRSFNHEQIKSMFYEFREKNWFPIPNAFEFFISEKGHNELMNLLKTPQTYLYEHGYPFYQSRANHHWSKFEDDFITSVANSSNDKIDFAKLALCIPGRTGKQIQTRYSYLIDNGIIEKPKEQNLPFTPIYHSYFLPDVEKRIATELKQMFKNGILISKQVVRSTAKKFYYCPRVLAERATIQHFINQSLTIFDENNKYTTEFLQFMNSLFNEIQENTDDDNLDYSKEVIRKFNLPKPIFGEVWANSFFKKKQIILEVCSLLSPWKCRSDICIYFY